MKIHQLYYRASGHLGQDETWYYAIDHEDGTWTIRHEWHNTDVKTGKSKEGRSDAPLDQTQLPDLPGDGTAKLRELLG